MLLCLDMLIIFCYFSDYPIKLYSSEIPQNKNGYGWNQADVLTMLYVNGLNISQNYH